MNNKTKTTIPATPKYATIGVQTYGLRLLRLALLLVLVMGGKGMALLFG